MDGLAKLDRIEKKFDAIKRLRDEAQFLIEQDLPKSYAEGDTLEIPFEKYNKIRSLLEEANFKQFGPNYGYLLKNTEAKNCLTYVGEHGTLKIVGK